MIKFLAASSALAAPIEGSLEDLKASPSSKVPDFSWSVWPHPHRIVCTGSQWAASKIVIVTNRKQIFEERQQVLESIFQNLGGASEYYDVVPSVESSTQDHLVEACATGFLAAFHTCVKLTIKSSRQDVTFGMKESYQINIRSNGVVELAASNYVGALHALESLSQLFRFDSTTERHYMPLSCAITDRPRFPHRGLLIDTGRHFLPIKFVKRIIDSLRMNKLNVLHWHLTDNQAWPYHSEIFAEIAEAGAFSQLEQYTVKELRYIVDYAAKRGIRIVAELDQPGHAASLYKSHPELFACAVEDAGHFDVALDPNNPKAFAFMYRLMDEFLGIFNDSHVHIGTDETPYKCYKESLARIKDSSDVAVSDAGADEVSVTSGFTPDSVSNSAFRGEKDEMEVDTVTPEDMFSKWVNTMYGHITSKYPGRKIVMWDEALNANPPVNGSVIQVWHQDEEVLRRAYDAGYTILSSLQGGAHDWYLDHLDVTWEQAYTNSVIPEYVSQENHSQFIGGEGCMWGETVDPSDFESTVWPRMSAIAERLWSPAGLNSTQQALPRLKEWRCTMLGRGVGVNPLGVPARSAPIYDDFDMSCGAVHTPGAVEDMNTIYV